MENKIHLITRVHLFIQHAFIWQLPCDIWQIAVIFFPLDFEYIIQYIT